MSVFGVLSVWQSGLREKSGVDLFLVLNCFMEYDDCNGMPCTCWRCDAGGLPRYCPGVISETTNLTMMIQGFERE